MLQGHVGGKAARAEVVFEVVRDVFPAQERHHFLCEVDEVDLVAVEFRFGGSGMLVGVCRDIFGLVIV